MRRGAGGAPTGAAEAQVSRWGAGRGCPARPPWALSSTARREPRAELGLPRLLRGRRRRSAKPSCPVGRSRQRRIAFSGAVWAAGEQPLLGRSAAARRRRPPDPPRPGSAPGSRNRLLPWRKGRGGCAESRRLLQEDGRSPPWLPGRRPKPRSLPALPSFLSPQSQSCPLGEVGPSPGP